MRAAVVDDGWISVLGLRQSTALRPVLVAGDDVALQLVVLIVTLSTVTEIGSGV